MANNSTFQYSPSFLVTEEIKKSFDENGFIIVKNLLSTEEVEKLVDFYENSQEVHKNAYGRDDDKGKQTKVCLWNLAGDDIGDMVSRSHKVVTTLEHLLGKTLYHYHSKLMMKEAEIGGQHLWHQDYGYWYENGCLFPDMGSAQIALDRSFKENGCLEVLSGSHLLGRLDHALTQDNKGKAKQRQVDINRLQEIKKKCAHVLVELNPGDAVFFHSLLVHSAGQNTSSFRRWAMICSYNATDNDPVWDHHHPRYTPLNKVENDAIMENNNEISSTDKWYFNPKDDVSVREK